MQHDGDVAEVEVEVDQGDLGAAAAEGDGQVGGQERLAAAALGAEDGDHPARGTSLARVGGRGAAEAPAQGPGDLERPGRGGPDGGLVAGRGQHVLDPDPQRLADQLARLLASDQQHRDVGGALLEGTGQGERVPVGEAGPEDGREHVAALGGQGGHGLVGVGGPHHPVGQPREGVGQPGPVAVVRFDDEDGHRYSWVGGMGLASVTPWLLPAGAAFGGIRVR